ncbi:hypothetical protein AC482_00625 [miscellaneous Crenarchaeota group-15 archaeon DG-45]|uniref:Uncharacterized protein n=1 Tax=miscellaneous Crenarchaeota group-15 archaeon DG-45 TaxID=1685127 RepID=A0A0M0BSB9_9ARCH|nr:MAG: hypothetical protein AC482_00625 [miscellaneous Crenarchaeota group-15 archaeon DG-45]
MAKKVEVKKSASDEGKASKLLRTVPRTEGFHFHKGPGDPTGKVAVGLADFAEKVRTVDIRAVNFHFKRREFEKWIKDTMGDADLARRIGKIRKDTHGETLRGEIIQIVKARLEELKEK